MLKIHIVDDSETTLVQQYHRLWIDTISNSGELMNITILKKSGGTIVLRASIDYF